MFLILKTKNLFLKIIAGLNRTDKQKTNRRYEFSEENSNINNADYLLDNSNNCNYALVGGSGEGTERVLVEIDNTQGLHDFDIVEKFIDAKGESQEELSKSEYEDILRQKGNEQIQEITQTIEFDVYANDYKKYWDLGDIVTVKKESWNVETELRITEVEEVIEEDKITITPTFGLNIFEKYTEDEEEF